MKAPVATFPHGAPIPRHGLTASLTAGKSGPILLEDFAFYDHLSHFDRERVPERVVHAKGAGAFGYFEVTSSEITKYCKAKLFSHVGKRTPLAVRFSQATLESGSPDSVRDIRGMALKFYTEEGNWNLVGNNTPIFFIRDPILFPSLFHALKRNPQTHLRDNNLVWDFFSLRPESIHQVLWLFSDRGIPDGYRYMDGFGSNTFTNVNANGELVYVKYHYKSDQGIRNLTDEEAQRLGGLDADYALRDLFEAIASKNYPTWTLYIQVMKPTEVSQQNFDPFDVTKVWPHKEFPLIEVGRLVFNRNPINYFAEVEQMAFSPARFVPGIGASTDKVLQGRLFSYTDTQYHRIGANMHQIPVNQPVVDINNYQIDGQLRVDGNHYNQVAHYPNSLNGPQESQTERVQAYSGDFGLVDKYETAEDDNYSQARVFYQKVLDDDAKTRMISNIAGALSNASMEVQSRMLGHMDKVHEDLGSRLRMQVKILNEEKLKGLLPQRQPTAPMIPPKHKVSTDETEDVLTPQFRRKCAVK
uniref:Catalase n=1 Tax=Albugo laibachii Nc14 TaxID=890382 RepID=F0WHJ5_9STRA|nr:unnamed protein product [Albugo laibachii Nc14]|eukprot:CCA20714.1 unnamed protein product [Albugo laibachii Nc14]